MVDNPFAAYLHTRLRAALPLQAEGAHDPLPGAPGARLGVAARQLPSEQSQKQIRGGIEAKSGGTGQQGAKTWQFGQSRRYCVCWQRTVGVPGSGSTDFLLTWLWAWSRESGQEMQP